MLSFSPAVSALEGDTALMSVGDMRDQVRFPWLQSGLKGGSLPPLEVGVTYHEHCAGTQVEGEGHQRLGVPGLSPVPRMWQAPGPRPPLV